MSRSMRILWCVVLGLALPLSAGVAPASAQVPPTADLSVTKVASPDVELDGLVTYVITVTNDGPADAAGVVLTDVLDVDLTLISVEASVGGVGVCVDVLATITCELGTITSGASETVTIVAAADALGLIDNTAVADSVTLDVDMNDRSATVTIQVGECPGFEGDPRNDVVGTSGNDVLTGTAGPDIICGLGGNDRLDGLGGNDLLIGGAGADLLQGGAGADVLRGGGGPDVLKGGIGNDRLYGEARTDRLYGGPGNDRLLGGGGRDLLVGGGGRDRLVGGAGNDRLLGSAGRDRLFGGLGRDRLFGGPGNDYLDGGAGFDLGVGGLGRDTFIRIERRRR